MRRAIFSAGQLAAVPLQRSRRCGNGLRRLGKGVGSTGSLMVRRMRPAAASKWWERRFLAASLLLAFTACSHGGATVVPAAAPPAPNAVATPAASGTGKLTLVIRVPATASAASKRRFPKYVSAAANGVRVTVNSGTPQDFAITPGSGNCPLSGSVYSCSVTVTGITLGSMPALAISIYDLAPVSGTIPATAALLASGTTTATAPITNSSNTISVVLDGIPATVEIATTSFLPAASSGSLIAMPVVRDAGGNAIVGSAPYGNASGAATTIALSIPSSITGYVMAVQSSGSMTFGSAGTTATLGEPGDMLAVTESGSASAITGVTIAATQSGSTFGVLRIPITTGSTVTGVSHANGPPTIESIPFDQSVNGNAPGQGVMWAESGTENGSAVYSIGTANSGSVHCGALNTVELATGNGFPGLFNVGSNGGFYYLYPASFAGLSSDTCTTNGGAFGTADSYNGAFGGTGQSPGPLEAAYGFIYWTNATGTGVAVGSYGSTLSSPAFLGLGTFTGGVTASPGIAVLPGRAVVATSTGIAVIYASTPTAPVQVTAPFGAPFYSPVAMADGTVYVIANSGNSIARCHVPADKNVTTGASCDASGTFNVSLSPNTALTAARSMVLGPDGALWYAAQSTNGIGRYNLATNTLDSFRSVTFLSIPISPYSLASGNDGHLYIMDGATSTVLSLP